MYRPKLEYKLLYHKEITLLHLGASSHKPRYLIVKFNAGGFFPERNTRERSTIHTSM